MLKAFYHSSFVAALAGVAAFGVSVLVMRMFGVPGEIVFAPGLAIQWVLNSLGADLPRRVAVFTTLAAWCLVADAVLMLVNKPWRAARETAGQ